MRAALAILLLTALAAPALAAAAQPPRNYFLEYYVFHLAGLMAGLTALTESALRRGAMTEGLARRAWNWGLLISFAACVIIGFVLFLPLDRSAAKLMFKLHVWTGVVCGWAGLYHAARRARAM